MELIPFATQYSFNNFASVFILTMMASQWRFGECRASPSSSGPAFPPKKQTPLPDFLFELLNLPAASTSSSAENDENNKADRQSPYSHDDQQSSPSPLLTVQRRPIEPMNGKMQQQQRAICPYKFVLNQQENRVPRTLIEVQCLSKKPTSKSAQRFHHHHHDHGGIRCEPMHWNMRVMKCQHSQRDNRNPNDDKTPTNSSNAFDCQEETIRLPLACLPVYKLVNTRNGDEKGGGEWGEESTEIVSVPAEEPHKYNDDDDDDENDHSSEFEDDEKATNET